MDDSSRRHGRLWGGIDAALPFVLAAFVAVCVLGNGMPELRHDWRIPAGAGATEPWLASLIDGWLPIGIGEPQPYPTFYLVGLLLWPLQGLGTFGLTVLVVAVTVVLAARAASDAVRALGGHETTCVAAAAFAALNPWVYAKYVTGHVFMIFAYAVLLALVAEVLRDRPRRGVLVVLAALSVTQLEFALFACVPLLVWALRRREVAVIASLVLAYAPIVVGIAASYGTIRATPFNFVWEEGQSIEPLRVAFLTGTTYGYASAFDRFWPASLLALVVALGGLPGAFARARTGVPFALGLVAAALATGSKGPFAHLFRFVVVHVAESGVFRELYHLVGLVAIAYVIAFGFGFGRTRVAGAALVFAAVAFAAAWIVVPPRAFFAAAGIARAAVPPGPGTRVAYAPFFQPLGSGGRGSGVDPDAYVRTDRALPINEVLPLFPVDAALARAAFFGDDRDLAALGVATIVARPYLQTDYAALRYQWPYREPFAPVPQRSRSIASAPMLSLAPAAPRVATIANRPGENAEFFGDADPALVSGFEPTRATDDPAAAWVDARLAVALHPAWGTAFGGVTTSASVPLVLPAHERWPALLALADGTLTDDAGDTIAARALDLHWWPLPRRARTLSCRGRCVVVLLGAPPAGAPEHVAPAPFAPVPVRFLTPWLATARLGAAASGALRLDVRYDGAWLAVRSGRVLPHRRVAGSLNGWQLDGNGTVVYFVERTAAIGCVLEFVAFAGIAALALGAALRGRSARREATSA